MIRNTSVWQVLNYLVVLLVFGEQAVVAEDWETVGKCGKIYPALLSSVK